MRSALIIHSRHTRDYAESIAKEHRNTSFFEVKSPPTKEILKLVNDKDIVIGIGGGSVIDTAKIIAKGARCIAVPTTASGACMTPYATVWGNEKRSIPTRRPVLRMPDKISINLPRKVRQSTLFDALSHATESFWAKDATPQSKKYARKAIQLLKELLSRIANPSQRDIYKLITAGNYAGQAIAEAGTNVVHAASYPITIEYGIDHGTACGMLLPHFIEFMDFNGLPELFDLHTMAELVELLKKSFIPPRIEDFDARLIAEKTMKYDRVSQEPGKITKKQMIAILKEAARHDG